MNKEEENFCEIVKRYENLIRFCEAKTGVFVDNYRDKSTWELFSAGRYSSPFFIPEYPSSEIKPTSLDELSEYVARGFFVEKEYTLAKLLYLKHEKGNPKRLIFREDVDELVLEIFERIGSAPAKKIEKIIAKLRNPASIDVGKDRLHDLCKEVGVSEKYEDIIYGKIVLSAPIFTEKGEAYAFAEQVYNVGFFQANFRDKYLYVIDRLNNRR